MVVLFVVMWCVWGAVRYVLPDPSGAQVRAGCQPPVVCARCVALHFLGLGVRAWGV